MNGLGKLAHLGRLLLQVLGAVAEHAHAGGRVREQAVD